MPGCIGSDAWVPGWPGPAECPVRIPAWLVPAACPVWLAGSEDGGPVMVPCSAGTDPPGDGPGVPVCPVGPEWFGDPARLAGPERALSCPEVLLTGGCAARWYSAMTGAV